MSDDKHRGRPEGQGDELFVLADEETPSLTRAALESLPAKEAPRLRLPEKLIRTQAPSRARAIGKTQARPVQAPARAPKPKDLAMDEPQLILRFVRSERLLHWAIAGPFMLCYLTALILLVVYSSDRTLPLRSFVSWTHRISGVLMLALPPIVLLTHRSEWKVHFENLRVGWLWTLNDLRWLMKMMPAQFNKKIELPEADKFNAAEKLNFMNVMASVPLYGLTGILIWMPGVAFWPWVFHVALAVSATPLMFGHIFMAVFNPDTNVGLSGMFTGFVDRHWAGHHYAKWFRRHFGDPELPGSTEDTKASKSKEPTSPSGSPPRD